MCANMVGMQETVDIQATQALRAAGHDVTVYQGLLCDMQAELVLQQEVFCENVSQQADRERQHQLFEI